MATPNVDVLAFGQYYQHLGRGHLSRLIVSPNHRGAGLGRALVVQLAQTGTRALDAIECSLFVLRTNLASSGTDSLPEIGL
ncbi:GNAT family N-acetyltransferase [Microbulbifer sp. SSSA002]|uniref:GNAT family N-acetyltransferase n=1 Tax=Microbulbifer sp. SSSA002 TaxID=3243376 RepID=UPI00403A62D6